MKNINWTVRIRNKAFWLALIPAVLLLIKAAAALLGYSLDLGDIGDKLMQVVEAAFLVLGIVGIVNDPTTSGLSDSTRAMGFDKPQ